VIGDAVRTDIAGAARAGLDALFIASGIHRADLMDGEEISPERLARLFSDGAPAALAAMPVLRW
jgi:ribonucleotide monophosphatase NagD (HAD superfamily)